MNHSIKPKCMTAVLLTFSLLIQGCSAKPAYDSITRSGFFFDTMINITIYDPSDEAILDRCFDMCRYYEQLLSMTIEGSDISRINNASSQAVYVSGDTIKLLDTAGQYYSLSDGMLDITVAPLSVLWTSARNTQIPPKAQEIKKQLSHVGSDKITIDKTESCVIKSDPLTMLDTGAIAKGFIADKLKELLKDNGVHSAIISLGGNILTIGSKPDGTPFKVGIRKPFSKNEEAAASLNISDLSVVTSGIYERCFTYDGRLYHHVLNPYTGYPADTDLCSATIISPSSLQADALSTICLLYGLDRAKELINNTPGVEAVFITEDEELHYTGGAEAFLNIQ